MNTPVEAQSLSSLTNLFANPPQYPRNPTHQVHESLVLYIVRVPGSKDVFLSPLKPPTKASISLEAIQSSLYYFHVNTPEDDEVRQSIDQQRQSEELSRPAAPIARKPLRSTPFAKHPLPAPPEAELQQYQAYRPSEPSALGRNNQSYTNGDADPGPGLRLNTRVNGSIHRKPVSPSGPENIYKSTGEYALSPSMHEKQGVYTSRNATPALSQSSARSYSPEDHDQQYQGHRPASPAVSSALNIARRANPKFPTITVIRRDPATGNQWNIGTISLLEPTFTGSTIQPVSVELTTPGYGRFARGAGFDTPRPGSAGSDDAASIRKALEHATISPASAASQEAHHIWFNRVVDFQKMPLSDLRRTVYQRTNSTDSVGKVDSGKPAMERNVLTFDSPWNGKCTFINGIDGNSLKLKHTISSNSSAAEGLTANIGELRFNLGFSVLGIKSKEARKQHKEAEPDTLPISKLLESRTENFRKSFQQLKSKSRESYQRMKSSDNNDDALRDLSNMRTPTTNNLETQLRSEHDTPARNGYINNRPPLPTRPSNTSQHQSLSMDDQEEQNRISLRLGRERAGGGFRGQSAKLGKLIIEDEGLKMCDLVVSAAMGVWWQHYEK